MRIFILKRDGRCNKNTTPPRTTGGGVDKKKRDYYVKLLPSSYNIRHPSNFRKDYIKGENKRHMYPPRDLSLTAVIKLFLRLNSEGRN